MDKREYMFLVLVLFLIGIVGVGVFVGGWLFDDNYVVMWGNVLKFN